MLTTENMRVDPVLDRLIGGTYDQIHHIQNYLTPNGPPPGLTFPLDIPAPCMRVYADAVHLPVEVKPRKGPAPDIHVTKSGAVVGNGMLLTSAENVNGLSKAVLQATVGGKSPPIHTEKASREGGRGAGAPRGTSGGDVATGDPLPAGADGVLAAGQEDNPKDGTGSCCKSHDVIVFETGGPICA